MITKVILGLVDIEVVNFYLVFTFKGLALVSQSLFLYGLPASLHFLSLLSVQPSWGAPLGGARLPKSLCRAGAKNEKNVGRPRAEAVAPRESLSEALVCIVNYFPWYEVLRLSCEANWINCNLQFKHPLFTIGESHITI
jgi:hypothetical protein